MISPDKPQKRPLSHKNITYEVDGGHPATSREAFSGEQGP